MLAYVDTIFSGLVNCKVISISYAATGGYSIEVEYTSTLKGYTRGAREHWKAGSVVPREAVYRSRQACGQFRVKPYSWAELAPKAGLAINLEV